MAAAPPDLSNVVPIAVQCAHVDPVGEEQEEVAPLGEADGAVLVGVHLAHEVVHLAWRDAHPCTPNAGRRRSSSGSMKHPWGKTEGRRPHDAHET